jgi:excisionase family DNA binding protein
MYEELLTVSEVARIFRVGDITVRRWIRLGALEAISLPAYGMVRHVHRIKRQELERVLNTAATP